MKKERILLVFISVIVVITMCLSLCACNDTSNTGSNDANSNEETSPAVEKQTTPSISIGETVTTDDFEFTLNKVKLSYNVEPDNPPSYYSYYAAEDGQVYIYINASVKNLSKHDIQCDDIYSVTADYDNGYTYQGFNIITDTDGDFTYANINVINPLQTLGVHCLVDCPEEIETSEKPLFITVKFRDGSEYLYNIR